MCIPLLACFILLCNAAAVVTPLLNKELIFFEIVAWHMYLDCKLSVSFSLACARARALPFSVSLSRSLVLSLTLSHSLSHIHTHTYTHDTNKRHRSNATRARFAGWLRYPFQSASLRMPHHRRQNSRPSWRENSTSWPKPLQRNKLLQWVKMAKEGGVVASTEQMWWRPGAFLLLNSTKSTRSCSKPLLRGPLHHSSAITITRRSSHCNSHCSSSSHRRRNYLLSRNRCRHSKRRWKHDTRRRRSISSFERKKQLWIKSSTLNLHWFPSWIWSSCFKRSTFFLPPFAGSFWFIAEVIFVRRIVLLHMCSMYFVSVLCVCPSFSLERFEQISRRLALVLAFFLSLVFSLSTPPSRPFSFSFSCYFALFPTRAHAHILSLILGTWMHWTVTRKTEDAKSANTWGLKALPMLPSEAHDKWHPKVFSFDTLVGGGVGVVCSGRWGLDLDF